MLLRFPLPDTALKVPRLNISLLPGLSTRLLFWVPGHQDLRLFVFLESCKHRSGAFYSIAGIKGLNVTANSFLVIDY